MSKKKILEIIDGLSNSLPKGDVKPLEYDRYFQRFIWGIDKIIETIGPFDPFLDGTMREVLKIEYQHGGGAPSSYNPNEAFQYNHYNGLKDFFVLLKDWVEERHKEGRFPVTQQKQGVVKQKSHKKKELTIELASRVLDDGDTVRAFSPQRARSDDGRTMADETPDFVLYTASRSESTCEIAVNGQVIASPHPGAPYDLVAEFLFKPENQDRVVSEKETCVLRGGQKFPKIISELGFSGDLRKVFFGSSSQNRVMFHNPITEDYLEQNHLPRLPQFEGVTHSATERNEAD